MYRVGRWVAQEVRRNGRNIAMVAMSAVAVSASMRALQTKKAWEPLVEAKEYELRNAQRDLQAERDKTAALRAFVDEQLEALERDSGRGAGRVREVREAVRDRLAAADEEEERQKAKDTPQMAF